MVNVTEDIDWEGVAGRSGCEWMGRAYEAVNQSMSSVLVWMEV